MTDDDMSGPEWDENDDSEDEYPPTFYSRDPIGRLNMPFSVDAAGLVWWSYNQLGLAETLFASPDDGVAEMVSHFESTEWRSADLILRWNDSPLSTAVARNTLNQEGFMKSGDLLFRVDSSAGDHVAFFISLDGSMMTMSGAWPLGEPAVGDRTMSYTDFVDTYTHLVRPMPVGVGMSYRYGSSIHQPVTKPVEVTK
jgi:hypothetical protein